MGQAVMGVAQPDRRRAGERNGRAPDAIPGRARREARIFEFKRAIPWTWTLGLGIAVWVIFFGLWELSAARGWVNPLFMPPPHQVIAALYRMLTEHGFLHDILISIYRILASFLAASAIATPIGILMGCFRVIDAFVNPFVAAWRYLPAPSFVPLLLMWFGAGEGSKLALLFIGVVFFLATLVMDHTRAVRSELIETAMTLGASRQQILTSVIVRAVLPNILVSMRQMLAVSWTYLVIAEIIASTTGIGAVMMRGQRFLHVDEIMAGIVVIGILGLLFDYLFRALHRLLFPYLRSDAS
ncbi:MAG: ABC transporter permease [Rhodospirillales bacterium]|nr:ABC transporter permease [Rhodospirillales bacterium]